jgi:hypothetical protein
MEIKQEVNQIKIIKLVNGDDVVCVLSKKQLGEKSPLLRLEKPLQIKYVPQLTSTGIKDYVALIKWAAYTADQIITIPKDKIMSISNANDDMMKSYFNVIKDYSIPDKILKDNQFERKRLTDSQNREINEIFDEEFEDDDYDIPNKTIH